MIPCYGIGMFKTVCSTPTGERIRVDFDSNLPHPESAEFLLCLLDLGEPLIEGVGVISGIIKDC